MKAYYELLEGVYDQNIFKAFFMAGGPGSGKSFAVMKGIGQAQTKVRVTAQGLKVVNSDDIFEKYKRLCENIQYPQHYLHSILSFNEYLLTLFVF